MAIPSTTEADCRPNARVIVGDTEVPFVSSDEGDGGVEIQMRKTGPSDLMRFSDIHVPFEWKGYDIISEITTPTQDSDPTDTRSFGNAPVRIDVLDEWVDRYVTAHQGPIASAGPSQLDGCFRLHVTDWANYLDQISAKREFKDPKIATAFGYVRDRAINEHDGIPEMGVQLFNVPEGANLQEPYFNQEEGEDPTVEENPYNDYEDGKIVPPAAASFNEYQHSLVDVVNWMCDYRDARWYVEYDPREEIPKISFDPNPTSPSLEGFGFDETPQEESQSSQSFNPDPNSPSIESGIGGREEDNVDEDGIKMPCRVITNNALFQISPQHTLGVHGQKLSEDGQKKMPRVIVEHNDLADRAGINHSPTFEKVSSKSLNECEQEAKSRLKRTIDDAAGGEVVTLPFGFARPYATIDARPTCSGRIDRDVDKVTYEIEEVVHSFAAPTQQHDGSKTILRCGIEVSSDDLHIRESRKVSI